jgi:hypothetical protein
VAVDVTINFTTVQSTFYHVFVTNADDVAHALTEEYTGKEETQ